MKVPSPTSPNVRPTHQGMNYLRPANFDLQGIARGMASFGESMEQLDLKKKVEAERAKQEQEKLTRFDSMQKFNQWQLGATDLMTGLQQQANPAQGNFAQTADEQFVNYGNKFISSLPPEMQDEFKVKVSETGQQFGIKAREFQLQQTDKFYRNGIDDAASKSKLRVDANPATLEEEKLRVDAMIDASGLSEIEKAEAKRLNAQTLEGLGYRKEYETAKITAPSPDDPRNLLRHFEGYRGTPYWDEDADRIGYGSDTVTLADGTIRRVTPGMKISRADAERDLMRRVNEFQNGIVGQIGQEAWASLPANVQSGITSVAYNYGKLPNDVVAAIKTGSVENIAQAVEGLSRHNGGKNARRRHQEAAYIRSGILSDVDNNPRYANVPYEDRVGLRTQGDANANEYFKLQAERQKAASAKLRNDFKVGIFDGSLGQKDFDEMRDLGLITDFEDIKQIQGMIDTRNKEAAELGAAARKLQTPGAIWAPGNEDDKKMLNQLFGATGTDSLSKGDQGYYDSVFKPLYQQTHMFPSDGIGMLDGMTRSLDPKQALFALNALSDMHASEPDAYERQVPQDLQSNVATWEALRNVRSAEEILAIVGGRLNSEQRNARANLLKEADTFLSDPTNDNYTNFDSLLKEMTPDTWYPGDANVQAPVWPATRLAMQDEWKTLLKENYAKTGDWGISQTLTVDQLKRTWGVTEFGGRQTLMKWPPEKAGYPLVLGSSQWMEDQTREELHIQPEVPMQLISDDVTQQQFMQTQAWEAGGNKVGMRSKAPRPTPPSYLVAVQGPNGWELAKNANDDIIRQHFEIQPRHRKAEETDFKIKQLDNEVDDAFARLMEAQEMQVLTGKDVPQELRDAYEQKKALVNGQKEAIVKQSQDMYMPAKDRTGQFVRPQPRTVAEGRSSGKGGAAAASAQIKPRERSTRTGRGGTPITPPALPAAKEKIVAKGYPDPVKGQIKPGNIDLMNRPVVDLGNGEKGTVRSISIEVDGETILIPTIVKGKLVSDEEAMDHYFETREQLGVFKSPEAAEIYARALSEAQGKRLGM